MINSFISLCISVRYYEFIMVSILDLFYANDDLFANDVGIYFNIAMYFAYVINKYLLLMNF